MLEITLCNTAQQLLSENRVYKIFRFFRILFLGMSVLVHVMENMVLSYFFDIFVE